MCKDNNTYLALFPLDLIAEYAIPTEIAQKVKRQSWQASHGTARLCLSSAHPEPVEGRIKLRRTRRP